MIAIVLLMIGGALGASSRYHLTRLVSRLDPEARFPIGTLAVNLVGSLCLGIVVGMRFGELPLDPYQDGLFLLAGVGFFGAFTTFSTFATEARSLFAQGNRALSAGYVVLTTASCVALFAGGFYGMVGMPG